MQILTLYAVVHDGDGAGGGGGLCGGGLAGGWGLVEGGPICISQVEKCKKYKCKKVGKKKKKMISIDTVKATLSDIYNINSINAELSENLEKLPGYIYNSTMSL